VIQATNTGLLPFYDEDKHDATRAGIEHFLACPIRWRSVSRWETGEIAGDELRVALVFGSPLDLT